MIYRMVQLVVVFLFIYLLGLLTFACIATLTLTQNPNFANLFEAMRTYFSASLGEFDLHQYDEDPGWKRFYGMGLHVVVLFINMILMINLLIAIMSDQYSLMQEVRVGLFWGSVINEIPKLKFDSQYGVLNIFPFFFYWISFLVLPFLLCIKTPRTLKLINQICFHIVYFPLSLVLLAVFMAVNVALLPFAYVKTIVHKALLLKRYKSQRHSRNLLVFVALGIPFLVLAQFTDAVRFMVHSYNSNQRQ